MARPLRLVSLAPLAGLALSACYGFLPAPERRDRVREATQQEHRRCTPQSADPRIFAPEDVASVEPLYSYVQTSGSNREARLLGAQVRLRPLPGVTSELLTYQLMCRSAQLVLGRVQAAENEPYWLPDGWVSIDVHSVDGDFVVALEGEDVAEAREILERARAFAHAKP
jgi:hypothetical protein